MWTPRESVGINSHKSPPVAGAVKTWVKLTLDGARGQQAGLSPRGRGSQERFVEWHVIRRSIPTGVGETRDSRRLFALSRGLSLRAGQDIRTKSVRAIRAMPGGAVLSVRHRHAIVALPRRAI